MENLKIQNKKLYTKKEMEEIFSDYEKTINDFIDNCDDNVLKQFVSKTMLEQVSLLDTFINATDSCPDKSLKMLMMLTQSLIGAMISSYLTDNIEKTLEERKTTKEEILKEIKSKLKQLLGECDE